MIHLDCCSAVYPHWANIQDGEVSNGSLRDIGLGWIYLVIYEADGEQPSLYFADVEPRVVVDLLAMRPAVVEAMLAKNRMVV